jgi:hypothetical protein
MKRHLNLKPYECNVCHAKFARSSTLKIHAHTHFVKNEDQQASSSFSISLPSTNDMGNNILNTLNSNTVATATSPVNQDMMSNALLMTYLSKLGNPLAVPSIGVNEVLYNNLILNSYRDNLLYNAMLTQHQQQMYTLLAAANLTPNSAPVFSANPFI